MDTPQQIVLDNLAPMSATPNQMHATVDEAMGILLDEIGQYSARNIGLKQVTALVALGAYIKVSRHKFNDNEAFKKEFEQGMTHALNNSTISEKA